MHKYNVGFFLHRNFNLSFSKAINIFITYNMITATSSLSSDKAFQSGTQPFKKRILKKIKNYFVNVFKYISEAW